MRKFMLLLLAAHTGAMAAPAQPYQMIVRQSGQMVVVPYASKARCLAAKAVIDQENERKRANAQREMDAARTPSGGYGLIVNPSYMQATCIPG